jgi:Reverse transcriptase (RNA-dependent DNA polymerase)
MFHHYFSAGQQTPPLPLAIRHSLPDTPLIIVAVSTDDMVIAATSTKAVTFFRSGLGKHFDLTDLEIRWLLGFEIKRDRLNRTISVNRKAYIESVAKKINLTNSKKVYTPMEPGLIYSKHQCPDKPITSPYREACGSVLWAAIISCPYIICD